MQKQEPSTLFGQERAASYDEVQAKVAPIMDALRLLVYLSLSDLPPEARILCVGVGTGAELFALATACPRWRFTAVEPAAPMLETCSRKAAELGVADRCKFHLGYLDSLEETGPFDAATCLLVSHFLTDRKERTAFFGQIATRLRPGGLLASADLAAELNSPAFTTLLPVWRKMLVHSGQPAEVVESYLAALRGGVAVLPPSEVASIIEAGGFQDVTAFFQSLLIHGWISKRAARPEV